MEKYTSLKDKIEIFFIKIKLKFRKFLRTKFGGYLWRLVSTAFVLGIAGGIGVFAAVAKTEGSSEIYAKKYFEHFMTHAWGAMYKATDLVDTTYINEKSFSEMMNLIVPERGSDQFEFVNRGNDGDYTLIDVLYEEQDSDVERVMTLRMHKKDKKTLLFLNQWEVCLSGDTVRDCTIIAPAYLNLSLDGISLEKCDYTLDEESGLRTYVVDEVLAGNHQIEITAPGAKSIKETFLWQDSNESYVVESNSVELTSSTINRCSDEAIDMVIEMYTGVLTKAGSESVKAYFETDEDKAKIDEVYKKLESQVNKEDGTTLTTMTFDSYDTNVIEYVCAKSFAVKFVFDTTFEAKEERTQMSGVRESYEGKSKGEAIVRFACRDGKWVPVAVGMDCFDYSRQEEIEE